ncbi:VOC family protein [Glycomyces harbinensis]|uniref:VOC domain-containing protein n=1 Tax=Glycomyces harbinensis TaxID=58114 RepID=A0A1G6TK75_9ACTN|nr:VOC family protein [Glycomyces harbinensis]SDD29592.1 hypothetical protein SAMN05216270_10327 [Glycomyces harbinensis]
MPTSIPLGAPIWADTNSPDVAADLEFYTRLFNWASFDSGEQFGHYTELCLGTTVSVARAVAGISQNPPGEPGMPAGWGVSFHVDDCVQAAADAEKLGGTIISHPMRVGEDLVYAAMRDPDGGAFGLFEPLSDHVGFTAFDEPGAIVWCEYVYDGAPVEAMQFYAELLNWSVRLPDAEDPPRDAPYVALWTHETNVEFGGGRMALGPELDMKPHWVVCFGTDTVELTVSKAVDLGGSVVVAPMEDPGGRMAVLASPTGAHFSVMSSRERANAA